MGDPVKYHEGNMLIHDPSGLIHFVNEQKYEYYWTAEAYQVPYTHEKDNNLKGYFGFMKGSNELFYFDESRPHKRINCNKLEEELDSINMGRKDGVNFKFSSRDSTFWLNFYDGTAYFHEKEVETQQLDMFQILRRDYRIWDAANKNKKMDLRFSRFIKCRGPCICKPYDAPHGQDDYTQPNIQLHEKLRDTNMFVLQFREYVDLLKYEHEEDEEGKKKFPRLPKVPLIVAFHEPVYRHDMAYHGLYQGHIKVIAMEITGKNLATKDRLSEILYKFNSNKQFLTFFGINEFKNRSFLVFESFSHHATDSTRETMFDGCSSQGEEELLKNLKGLIEGVSYMHNEMKFPGNIGTSNVVVVKNGGNGQNELKLFVGGSFVDDKSKTTKDDLRGLAQVFHALIAMFRCASEESKHLIQCLRNASCNISDLKEHPTFWIPQTKLEFIAACYLAWWNIRSFEQSLPNIERAIKRGKRGDIDTLLFRRMEKYGSYSIGKPSGMGQLTRFIRHAKTHEQELSKEDVGRFYNGNLKGMEGYFRDRYPNLLIELYKLVQQKCARHEIFELFDIPSV